MKSNDKTKVTLTKQESEIASLTSQISRLEEIKANNQAQMLKMGEEIKFLQAKISQLQETVFEAQTENNRKKAMIAEFENKVRGLKDDKARMSERMGGLEAEILKI
jgi:ubiquinone biosynthesis protein UbiJ